MTRPKRRWCLAAGLVLLAASVTSAAGVEPSANKGRRGTYLCDTTNPTYKYYVCVPEAYTDDNPAGLHLFFHGQGVPSGPAFGGWSKHFLEPFDLIGINMHYTDGNNMADTAGKVAAAVEAIQQTIADYRVIRGRGVVASFSGGGVPHGILVTQYAKRGTKRGDWPFNHSAPYDSNFRANVRGLVPMSWFLALGEKEYTLAALGFTQTTCAMELFADAQSGGCPDVYLRIAKGKGHSIDAADVTESAKVFRRSDLAFSPFLYEKDFPEHRLAAVVLDANRLDLGRADAALKTLLAATTLDPELRTMAEFVRRKLDERVEAILALAKELDRTDPVLAAWYLRRFAQHLKGHPREKEMKPLLEASKKREKDVAWALDLFAKHLREFFTPTGRLQGEAVPVLEKVKTRMGDESLFGRMSADFLQLK